MLDRSSCRFVAGPSLEKALALVREDNLLEIYGVLNYLGEHFEDEESVNDAVQRYTDAIREIRRRKLGAQISLKPTQIGLRLSESIFRQNLTTILKEAETSGVFVWVDMESSRYTQQTIDAYRELRQFHGNTGITLQACLKRTENDLDVLMAQKAIVRLVKGAYAEKDELLVGGRTAVAQNYRLLMRMLFENGGSFVVATHDDELLDHAVKLSEEYQMEPEFQLLLGVREGLQARLAADGYRVGEYIPYGKKCLRYFERRVREKKTALFKAPIDFFAYRHERLARV